MELSLSVRIAESFSDKERLTLPFARVIALGRGIGYRGVCMRASVVGVASPVEQIEDVGRQVRDSGLAVSMVTGDIPLAANDERASEAIRNITPYLDLAQALGAKRVRVMMKTEADVPYAQRAADEASERGMLLCHQTHTGTLFERIEDCLRLVGRINRRNFGITFEPANLLVCGDDYGPAAIGRLDGLIFNVYLQNLRLTPDGSLHMETNQGTVRAEAITLGDARGVRMAQVVEGLQAIGYDGWITVHSAVVPGHTVEATAREAHGLLQGL